MRGAGRGVAVAIGVVVAGFALPAVSPAHIERPSYWPDPGPDRSVKPPAGGKVPKVRPLAQAVTGKGRGDVRVVCAGKNGRKSMKLLRKSVRKAKRHGYKLRPSQPRKHLSRKRARKLLKLNRKLAKQCEYSEIQPAVFDSGNNDRVVVMPGIYREPTSRAQPLNDPKCAEMTQLDSSGAETPSYRYQVNCPNDQNLIYVQGRSVPDEPPPEPPLENRHGIPDEGKCVRCNFQLEGSGVKPTDVIVDGGSRYAGKGPEARPRSLDKHVDIRVDRADGFVLYNLTTRGALEHGVYVEETDGYRIDRVKMFWAADYGNLTFTSDHGLYTNCDGFGAGDAVLYPGAAPETGEQADLSFYPDAPRINTVVRNCDMRGSVLAYSGSMGNAVRITRNHVYANAAGISTDTISASGHPGFPADSVQVDHNLIYSNNLDLFEANPPVEPVVGVLPVGTGIFWAGHNNGRVHDNWIFDNWRAGTFLLSVPDALVDPEGAVNPGISCPTAPVLTTSCANRYFDNHMGRAPRGFVMHKAARKFGNPVGGKRGRLPNGVDFWWDEAAGNTGNCWFDNTGPDGTGASIKPGIGDGADALPSDCATSVGAGDPVKLAYLLACFLAREGDLPPESCDWYDTPPRPGSGAARRKAERWERGAQRFLDTERAEELSEELDGVTGIADSSPAP